MKWFRKLPHYSDTILVSCTCQLLLKWRNQPFATPRQLPDHYLDHAPQWGFFWFRTPVFHFFRDALAVQRSIHDAKAVKSCSTRMQQYEARRKVKGTLPRCSYSAPPRTTLCLSSFDWVVDSYSKENTDAGSYHRVSIGRSIKPSCCVAVIERWADAMRIESPWEACDSDHRMDHISVRLMVRFLDVDLLI